MAEGLVSADEAAQRLGLTYKTFLAACRHGAVPDAIRNPDWPKRGPCWWVPEALIDGLQRDSNGRIIWKPREVREKPGVKLGGYQSDRRPRCECCGMILEESGLEDEHGNLIHAADSPDAGRCWMCKSEYGESDA